MYVYMCVCMCVQEFAKSMEPENIKADLIQLFHNLANDEQVHYVGETGLYVKMIDMQCNGLHYC